MRKQIQAGQGVQIKKEWRDAGDEKISFIAVTDEDGGRVVIEAQLGLPINPTQTVKAEWLIPDVGEDAIGDEFSIGKKTYRVTAARPVDPALTNTIRVMRETGKELFQFSAGLVLQSGETSKKQGGLFLRFESGRYISAM